jgi:hypothetical protein
MSAKRFSDYEYNHIFNNTYRRLDALKWTVPFPFKEITGKETASAKEVYLRLLPRDIVEALSHIKRINATAFIRTETRADIYTAEGSLLFNFGNDSVPAAPIYGTKTANKPSLWADHPHYQVVAKFIEEAYEANRIVSTLRDVAYALIYNCNTPKQMMRVCPALAQTLPDDHKDYGTNITRNPPIPKALQDSAVLLKAEELGAAIARSMLLPTHAIGRRPPIWVS